MDEAKEQSKKRNKTEQEEPVPKGGKLCQLEKNNTKDKFNRKVTDDHKVNDDTKVTDDANQQQEPPNSYIIRRDGELQLPTEYICQHGRLPPEFIRDLRNEYHQREEEIRMLELSLRNHKSKQAKDA
jgi:hypothetical protein